FDVCHVQHFTAPVTVEPYGARRRSRHLDLLTSRTDPGAVALRQHRPRPGAPPGGISAYVRMRWSSSRQYFAVASGATADLVYGSTSSQAWIDMEGMSMELARTTVAGVAVAAIVVGTAITGCGNHSKTSSSSSSATSSGAAASSTGSSTVTSPSPG